MAATKNQKIIRTIIGLIAAYTVATLGYDIIKETTKSPIDAEQKADRVEACELYESPDSIKQRSKGALAVASLAYAADFPELAEPMISIAVKFDKFEAKVDAGEYRTQDEHIAAAEKAGAEIDELSKEAARACRPYRD